MDKQIESERKIATIQLRHEALRELRVDLDKNYKIWKDDINIPKNGLSCQSSVINFSSNYSYLFDDQIIAACSDFVFKTNDVLTALLDNDLDKAEKLFSGMLMKKINLYGLIGRKVIQ